MAEADIIKFFNRYTGRVETEQVYGAAWLRWIYGNPVGRLALEAVVKRPFFSRWYGWRMDREGSRHKVMPFIRDFGLDVREFADPPESFVRSTSFSIVASNPASVWWMAIRASWCFLRMVGISVFRRPRKLTAYS